MVKLCGQRVKTFRFLWPIFTCVLWFFLQILLNIKRKEYITIYFHKCNPLIFDAAVRFIFEPGIKLWFGQTHWVQSKCHSLWFSAKTCSCYLTKTYVDSVILILKLKLTSLRNIYKFTLKCMWCSKKTTFNVYVSQEFREPQPVTLWLYPVKL